MKRQTLLSVVEYGTAQGTAIGSWCGVVALPLLGHWPAFALFLPTALLATQMLACAPNPLRSES